MVILNSYLSLPEGMYIYMYIQMDFGGFPNSYDKPKWAEHSWAILWLD